MSGNAPHCGQDNPLFERLFERACTWLNTHYDAHTLATIRGRFQDKTGRVFPDDDSYDSRLDYFLVNLLFEADLWLESDNLVHSKPPYSIFLTQELLSTDPDFELFVKFNFYLHSVFLHQGTSGSKTNLLDLLTRKKHSVLTTTLPTALERNQIIQGFIFPLRGQFIFGRGLIIHPKDATCAILSLIKTSLNDRQGLLEHLARLQMRTVRLSHIQHSLIYQDCLKGSWAPQSPATRPSKSPSIQMNAPR